MAFVPSVLHFGQIFNPLHRISLINSRILNDPLQGLYMNKQHKETNRKLFEDENHMNGYMKSNLRIKNKNKIGGVLSLDISNNDQNNSERKNRNLHVNVSNGDADTLSKQDSRCETKYNLLDKLKGLNFIYKLMGKKKIITVDSCQVETCELLFTTLRNTNSLLHVLATLYGLIPCILVVLIALSFFITFNKTLLFFIAIISTELIVDDLLLKNILRMKRPPNSALETYGMPSGHSAYAFSLITFILLHLTECYKNKWHYIVSALALITLLPIPWSRVYIEDHTLAQTIVGSLLGMLIGFFFFHLKKKYIDSLCDK